MLPTSTAVSDQRCRIRRSGPLSPMAATASRQDVIRDDDLPAVFWTSMPENQDNPDAAAIEALIAESTPEERAEGFKVCCVVWAAQSASLLSGS